VIIILRLDKANRQPGRKTFILLGCERSGKYKKYKTVVYVSVTDSRKCDCSFKLRDKPSSHGGGWMLKVICGLHNHALSHTLVGHPYAERLKKDEHKLVVNMTKSQVRPTNILLTLEKDAHNVTTIKQLYNDRYTYKRSVRGPRTKMQQLMTLLERDQYIHWSRCHMSSEVVSDVFWTHPDYVKLLNAFHIVLLMNSTYKTNKYRLSLLEIVCVTSTGLTFSIAFVLLSNERENKQLCLGIAKIKRVVCNGRSS